MKTLQRYLLRQVLASLLMALAVFTFVILLVNVLKEVLPLLVSQQASLATVSQFIGLLIPWVWFYALPMSVLAAILLVFGRFSADHELTAARASGISLLSLALPVLLLSLGLCGICAAINLEIGPMCRKAYKNLRFQFLAEISGALLPEKQFIRDYPGYIFYVGRNRSGSLQDILIVYNDPNGAVTKLRAERGKLTVDATNNVFRLHLSGVRGVTISPKDELVHDTQGDPVMEVPMTKTGRGQRRASLGELTFSELQQELRDLEAQWDATPATNAAGKEVSQAKLKRMREDALSPVRVELHRKVAMSFACFGFALIGIPLGIRVQRRESNVGFALALVLVVIYYAFILAGSALESKSGYLPHLWMWAPNFIFQVVGIRLLWRANRGA